MLSTISYQDSHQLLMSTTLTHTSQYMYMKTRQLTLSLAPFFAHLAVERSDRVLDSA